MFYRQQSNQYINEGQAFTVDGVQYPANWLNLSTPADKTALGLEEVVAVGTRGDDRFYWVAENLEGATLTYTNTPKDIDGVRETLVAQVKQTAFTLLLPTDYKFTRKQETGQEVDQATLDARAEIRAASAANITAIEAALTVDELAAILYNPFTLGLDGTRHRYPSHTIADA